MISIDSSKSTLSNGLDVILHEDHSLPLIAVNIWYHVGSKDEEAGRTGFAHLFEHVMFEGSKNHNSSFFEPLQDVGASVNGSTTTDRTNYWVNAPSGCLELVLWLESDRMGSLLEALDQQRLDIQRDVVKNERRQSYENRPYGMAHILLQPAVFPPPHPYHWTTIGAPEDLDAAGLDDVKAFFRRFYTPSNASLTIAGDFDPDRAMRLVERYFGDIPPGEPINRTGLMDSGLSGRVSMTMGDRVQLPRLYMVWPSPALFDRDQAPLELLSVVLADGKSSRLHRSLVYEKQIARDVGVFNASLEIAGALYVQATASPGHGLDEIEGAVQDELERVRREPPTDHEVARARNRILNQHVFQLEQLGGFGGRADQLNYYNTMAGDPGAVNTDLDRYMAVTGEEVRRAASSVLGDNLVRLSVVPKTDLTSSPSSLDRSSRPVPSAPARFTAPQPVTRTLPNGLRIVSVHKPGVPAVAMGLMVLAGANTDPAGSPGLAHLTATMLPEGTATRTSRQIADEMEFIGSSLSSNAGRESVLLAAEALTPQWLTALDVMLDVAMNATFPDEELERIRRERLTDLARIADSPPAIAAQAARALLYGPDSRRGHPVTGVTRSVEAMTRASLTGRFSARFRPDNAVLLVAGDVSHEEVTATAEERLARWSADGPGPAPAQPEAGYARPGPTTIYLADKPGAVQSVIRAGHLTIPRHHEEYHAMNLLNHLFGGQFTSRLNMNLRQEKGYSYGYSSAIDWSLGPSALLAGGGVQAEVTKEAVAETLKEFAGIRGDRPVTEEEFAAARTSTLRALPAHFETVGQALRQLTRLVLFDLPLDYFASLPSAIESVTLDDVRRVARERLDSDHLAVLVVGDAGVVEPGLAELGVPIVHVDYEGRPSPAP